MTHPVTHQGALAPVLFISAGEASGDSHGADLMAELKKVNPRIEFIGMGGARMREQGCKILVDHRKVSVVGAIEILAHLKDILAALKTLKKSLKTERPTVVILIDFPGFNFNLARYAKKLGLKVVYYIPPQIWAWHRQARIKKLKKYVDTVAVIYPFEVDFYREAGINAIYVKNPLLKKAPPTLDRQDFCRHYGLDPARPILGIAPGSRLGEIKRMWSMLLEAAEIVKKQIPEIQIIAPLALSLSIADLQAGLAQHPNLSIQFIQQHHRELFHACDAMMAASGTVTTEIALARTPCVVTYKVSSFSGMLGHLLIKVKYASIVNLILNRQVLPELIQENANSEAIARETISLLTNQKRRAEIIASLDKFRAQLEETEAKNFEEILAK